MFELKKVLAKVGILSRAKREYDSDLVAPEGGKGLEVEYHALIVNQLRRCGIDAGCVSIEVRNFGQAGDGCDVFVCVIQLAAWTRASGLRLLLGLPMLEAKVRKMIETTWLADISHFGGLWLHASQHLHGMPGTGELRDLIKQLTPRLADASMGGSRDSQPDSMPALDTE